MEYIILRKDDELYHHGVKGMKWGVRRYQNADGTLTDAGKRRQARVDASDERYRKSQTIQTTRYYEKNRGIGRNKVEGINSLEKKLNSQSNRWDKDVVRGQLEVRKALQKAELTKVSNLTHDQIQKERVAVGKQAAKDCLVSIGVSALLVPTTGLAYIQTTNAQNVRSRTRWEDE